MTCIMDIIPISITPLVICIFIISVPGAEIGVLKSLPFDKINVNMFLIEMYHFSFDFAFLADIRPARL